MERRAKSLVLIAGCFVTQAMAQPGSAGFQLSWVEVDATTHEPVANPNGVLEPGEAVRITTSVAISPPVGAAYPGGGVVAGFADALLGIETTRPGAWSDFQVAAGFFHSPFGPPAPTRLMREVGQTLAAPGGVPVATNPIPDLFSAVWTPLQYLGPSVQSSLLQIDDIYPGIYVRFETGPQGPWFARADTGTQNWGTSITIPMVPAPSVGVLVVGGMMVGWRQRRG